MRVAFTFIIAGKYDKQVKSLKSNDPTYNLS